MYSIPLSAADYLVIAATFTVVACEARLGRCQSSVAGEANRAETGELAEQPI